MAEQHRAFDGRSGTLHFSLYEPCAVCRRQSAGMWFVPTTGATDDFLKDL